MISPNKQSASLHKPHLSNPLERYLINKSKFSPVKPKHFKKAENGHSLDVNQIKRYDSNPFLLNNLTIDRHSPIESSFDWYCSTRLGRDVRIKKVMKTNQPLLNILLTHQEPKKKQAQHIPPIFQLQNRPQTNHSYRAKHTRSEYPLKMSKKSIELDQCFMIKVTKAKCTPQIQHEQRSKLSKFVREGRPKLGAGKKTIKECNKDNCEVTLSSTFQVSNKYMVRHMQNQAKVKSMHKQKQYKITRQSKRKVQIQQGHYRKEESRVNPWSTTIIKGCSQEPFSEIYQFLLQ